ncbi:hypothetical protein K431DRAFT_16219 [Polychaeton citri CBS 116435]|uniref:Uncharacterized protein n=1 Tax=Polychaeton citri CBS 116435 TaxID=1314669 RepID=A0A9P4QD14_9PEZI|nr:hypothetical protein K431DRAFT_16219 [Polychaeton citri CBS 116435]
MFLWQFLRCGVHVGTLQPPSGPPLIFLDRLQMHCNMTIHVHIKWNTKSGWLCSAAHGTAPDGTADVYVDPLLHCAVS